MMIYTLLHILLKEHTEEDEPLEGGQLDILCIHL